MNIKELRELFQESSVVLNESDNLLNLGAGLENNPQKNGAPSEITKKSEISPDQLKNAVNQLSNVAKPLLDELVTIFGCATDQDKMLISSIISNKKFINYANGLNLKIIDVAMLEQRKNLINALKSVMPLNKFAIKYEKNENVKNNIVNNAEDENVKKIRDAFANNLPIIIKPFIFAHIMYMTFKEKKYDYAIKDKLSMLETLNIKEAPFPFTNPDELTLVLTFLKNAPKLLKIITLDQKLLTKCLLASWLATFVSSDNILKTSFKKSTGIKFHEELIKNSKLSVAVSKRYEITEKYINISDFTE